MADRLSIDKEYAENYIPNTLDKLDILRLSSHGERMDLFMLAMAIGVNKGVRTPSNPKKGWILESSAKGKALFMSYIDSVALNDLRKEGQENQIADTNVVYQIAEEYANTGFEELKKHIPNDKSYNEENLLYGMLENLNKLYDSIMDTAGVK